MPLDKDLRNITLLELNKLIDDRIEERIRSRMIGQNDILPQTIKERHIDWEEFGVTVKSSITDHISADLIKKSSTGTYSQVVNNGALAAVQTTISDSDSSTSRIIMAVINTSAYETSVTSANKIPQGSNLLYDDYIRMVNHDWGSSDGLNQVIIDIVRNNSGGNETVLWRSRARYIGNSSA